MQYVTAQATAGGQKGWTTHRQVSLAFGQSSHWDPGFWPRRMFGRQGQEARRRDSRQPPEGEPMKRLMEYVEAAVGVVALAVVAAVEHREGKRS